MKKFVCFAAILILCLRCMGQIPDPLPNTYVNDFANVLSKEQIATLNDSIAAIEKRSSVQIAVVLVNTLPANMEIDQYTLAIGRKWHVGNANNGLVYVASLQEHHQRLEVANNLQGDIPDITAAQILDGIKPYYKQQDWYGGITNMLHDVTVRIDPVAKEQNKLAEFQAAKTAHTVLIVFLRILGAGAIMFLCYWFLFRPKQIKKKKREEVINDYVNNITEKYTTARSLYIPPVIPRKSSASNTSSRSATKSSSSSYDSGSSKSDSSSYGSWGGSGDSGFSGGGASGSW